MSGEIVARINKADWSNYNEIGDYSYEAARTTYAAWTRVTLYRNGQLIWGVEPGGAAPSPTATQPPAPLPTATRTATPVPTATATTPSSATATPVPVDSYAVNSGGSATGAFGADAFVSSGNTYSTNAVIDTSGVYNPAPQAVYQTERWSSTAFTYTLSSLTPGRSYLVRLHFAEIVMSGPHQRQFNVAINTMPLLTNYDVFAAAGARNKAVVYEVSASANSSGQIVVAFSKGRYDNPKVSGIQLIR
jgi:hypothetical protein